MVAVRVCSVLQTVGDVIEHALWTSWSFVNEGVYDARQYLQKIFGFMYATIEELGGHFVIAAKLLFWLGIVVAAWSVIRQCKGYNGFDQIFNKKKVGEN